MRCSAAEIGADGKSGYLKGRCTVACRAYFTAVRAEEGAALTDFSFERCGSMNSTVMHERPGVYSSYDASSAISGGTAKKVIGVAARAAKGEANRAVRITSYTAGVSAFGEDNESSAMEGLLRLLYQNGAAAVAAVAVAAPADKQDYEAAFAALSAQEDVSVVVCDSADTEVLQALRERVTRFRRTPGAHCCGRQRGRNRERHDRAGRGSQ